MIFQVHTSLSTHKLHQDAKETCQTCQIRVSSKETDIEHAKRIGIICGVHVKLASNRKHASMISNETKVLKKNIEIREKIFYEKKPSQKCLWHVL